MTFDPMDRLTECLDTLPQQLTAVDVSEASYYAGRLQKNKKLCKLPDTQGLMATSRCGLQSFIFPGAIATPTPGAETGLPPSQSIWM